MRCAPRPGTFRRPMPKPFPIGIHPPASWDPATRDEPLAASLRVIDTLGEKIGFCKRDTIASGA